ncbi:MAG: hypothetical protein ACR2K3_00130 [Nocardioides sp.]
MVDRVFLHLGLPKTGTSYLQTIVWPARDRLAADGIVLPGRERRDHLWASRVVRGEKLGKAPKAHRTSWKRLRAELASSPGTGLLSHEFFAAASARQAAGVIEQLAPAEVHLVVTAREPLGLFTASWQESLKNKSTTPMADYSRSVSHNPRVIWNWRALDLRLVLRRWATEVPPEHVHVLPLDPMSPRAALWHTFADLIGVGDPAAYPLEESFPNVSMGVAEAETLRRVNAHLGGFGSALDRGVWVRTFLADERLVPRGGERFWPEPEQIQECRRRGRKAVRYVERQGYDVRGDLQRLLVPEDLPTRRVPASVTEAEVAEVAVELAARLVTDARELRRRGQ